MIEFWYASYIFLGLSLVIGVGIYLIYRELSRRYKKRRKQSPLRELEKQFLESKDSQEDEPDRKK